MMAPKQKEISSEVRNLIVKNHQEGRNQCELARIFGISRSTIKSILKKIEQFGNVENRPGRGRKRLFTGRDETQLSRLVKLNRKRSLKDLTGMINELKDHSFCTKTIHRKLSTLGYNRRVAKKKVVVREVNRRKRVLWCRERKNWTVAEHWRKWIFSDESQIVIGSNNRVYLWRKDDEVNSPHLVCPAEKTKVSVMVWGCLSFEGIETLTPVDGIIDSNRYINNLEERL